MATQKSKRAQVEGVSGPQDASKKQKISEGGIEEELRLDIPDEVASTVLTHASNKAGKEDEAMMPVMPASILSLSSSSSSSPSSATIPSNELLHSEEGASGIRLQFAVSGTRCAPLS